MTGSAHGHQTSKAERAGRRLGRLWRGLAHQESRLACALVARGIARPVVMTTVWTIKVAALACLIYLVMWLGLAVVLVMAVAHVVGRVPVPKGYEAPVLRDGLMGYGFYDADGLRVDPHVSHDP
jgi:type VI protein secretion system component VasF